MTNRIHAWLSTHLDSPGYWDVNNQVSMFCQESGESMLVADLAGPVLKFDEFSTKKATSNCDLEVNDPQLLPRLYNWLVDRELIQPCADDRCEQCGAA